MEENTIFRPEEVEGKTKFTPQQIIEIAKRSIEKMIEDYELEPKSVLYDKISHITKEPVWYVDVIPTLNKERWSDSYETLAISDVTGEALYIMNDHGVAHEIK